MKKTTEKLFILIVLLSSLSAFSQEQKGFEPKEVYKSKDLIVTQVSENSFVHTSYLKSKEYNNFPCNGLVVRDKKEVIVFDSPTDNKGAKELIKWIDKKLGCKITAIIPTHFHEDCLGGLKAFESKQIPSYASFRTIEFAKANKLIIPEHGFKDSFVLAVGEKHIVARFFGEGHTKDNVVGYFPSENILFGGCLIKELGASKGFLGDANTAEWSKTVKKIKSEYPKLEVVVPGHGKYGGTKLLDYTIELFMEK